MTEIAKNPGNVNSGYDRNRENPGEIQRQLDKSCEKTEHFDVLKGYSAGKKLDIGELHRLHIKRTFISLSTFPDISPP